VHRVKTFGVGTRELFHARGDDAKTRFLEAGVNLADDVVRHGVGFDDGQRPFSGHWSFLRFLGVSKLTCKDITIRL
jgi:hypothetical protein